jgi:hypothetical protein
VNDPPSIQKSLILLGGKTVQIDWNQIVQSITGYVPTLVGAIAILIIGWIVASIIAAVVRGAFKRTNLDNRLANWLAGGDGSKAIDLGAGIAKGVYYIILLLVLVAFFQVLGLTIITQPINALLNKVLQFLPQLVGAGILLLIAWALATLVRLVLSKGLQAAKIDERFGKAEGEEGQPRTPMSKTLSEAAYWLVFLLFLPAVLGALNLTGLLLPVQGMVDKLIGFLPNLLGATIILAIGWFVALIVSRLVTSILAGIGADRIGERIGVNLALSGFLGKLVYILIFIPVVIAALNALQLQALTQPASNMLNLILGFIPNLFAAAIILGVGWFIASLLQRFITNLLASIGADRISEQLGVELKLSVILGTVVYALTLIPVLIAALNALALDAVTQPASNMLNVILAALPAIFTAIAVLGISYVLARVVSKVVTNILTGVGFNSVPVWLSLGGEPEEGKKTASEIVGGLILVGIMLFATIEAFDLLGFVSLVTLLNTFITLAGRILLGLIIFGVGLYLANLAARAIQASKTTQPGVLAALARVTILALTGAMALRQMGLANEIINLAFGLLLGAAAVAFAIAFGIGGRDIAARQLERWSGAIEDSD